MTKEILPCIGACAVLVAAPSQYAPHPNAVCVYLLEVNTLLELETALWLAWLVEYASYNRPKGFVWRSTGAPVQVARPPE